MQLQPVMPLILLQLVISSIPLHPVTPLNHYNQLKNELLCYVQERKLIAYSH